MVSVRRWGLGLMGLALVLAVASSWLFIRQIRLWQAGLAEGPAVVAAVPISPYTTLTAEMLTERPLAARYRPAGLFTDRREVVGRTSRVAIAPGEWVSAGMLWEQEPYAAGERALDLTLGPVITFGADLAAGDYVDIFASFQEGGQPVTRLVQAGVPVAAVRAEGPPAVTVVVSLEQAQELIWLENYGRQVRLVRRPGRVGRG